MGGGGKRCHACVWLLLGSRKRPEHFPFSERFCEMAVMWLTVFVVGAESSLPWEGSSEGARQCTRSPRAPCRCLPRPRAAAETVCPLTPALPLWGGGGTSTISACLGLAGASPQRALCWASALLTMLFVVQDRCGRHKMSLFPYFLPFVFFFSPGSGRNFETSNDPRARNPHSLLLRGR